MNKIARIYGVDYVKWLSFMRSKAQDLWTLVAAMFLLMLSICLFMTTLGMLTISIWIFDLLPWLALGQLVVPPASFVLADNTRGFGPQCNDTQSWNTLKPYILPGYIRFLNRNRNQSLTPWSNETYLEYHRTGSRSAGELMMTSRVNLLTNIAMNECLTPANRSQLEETLIDIAKQPTWTIPAHDRNLEYWKSGKYTIDLYRHHRRLSRSDRVHVWRLFTAHYGFNCQDGAQATHIRYPGSRVLSK